MNIVEKIKEKITNANLFKFAYVLLFVNTIFAIVYYFIKVGVQGLTDVNTIGVITSAYGNIIFIVAIALIYLFSIVKLFKDYFKNNKNTKKVKILLAIMSIFIAILSLFFICEKFSSTSKICYSICYFLLFCTINYDSSALLLVILGAYFLIPLISLIISICIVDKNYLKKIIKLLVIIFIPILVLSFIIFFISNILVGILLGILIAFCGKYFLGGVTEGIIEDIDKEQNQKRIIKDLKNNR